MIGAARAALHALLVGDALFVADLQALGLGRDGSAAIPEVVSGNRRFDQLGQAHYPCWTDAAGDQQGEAGGSQADAWAGLALGSGCQGWRGDILLALIWHQQDPARAVSQTDGLLPALVRLLLRQPSLSETCTLAYVASTDNDRGVRHPTHVAQFVVRVHYDIRREGS
jgi:hypothetical protein